jgi:hypothetical protein
MAANAKTNQFMIGDATIMVGAMADVFDLMPDKHGLGLTKNLAIRVETGNVDLTQGISQTPIFSVQNQFSPMASCEVYEYTARNLAYGLGLDGSGAEFDANLTPGPFMLASNVVAAAVSVPLAVGAGSGFVVGDWVIMQQAEDYIFAARVTAKTTDTLTIDRAVPTGISYAVATTRIFRARSIGAVGGQNAFVSVKAAVIMPKDKRPVPILFPKVRIARGFDVSLGSSDFSNLPFEFMPYPLTPEDTLYSSFGVGEVFKILPQ